MPNSPVIESAASTGLDGLAEDLDPKSFRRVCGAFPTGVAVVSTLDPDGRPCGLTVNSFTSVSLSPPLVLWCLSSHSPSLPHFDAADAYSISILADNQQDLATRFAKPIANKFEGVGWRRCGNGVPFIEECLGYLECRPWNRIDAGDHIIFLWRVERSHLLTLRSPLAFHAGGFRRISS